MRNLGETTRLSSFTVSFNTEPTEDELRMSLEERYHHYCKVLSEAVAESAADNCTSSAPTDETHLPDRDVPPGATKITRRS
jgi:hypothetical protein